MGPERPLRPAQNPARVCRIGLRLDRIPIELIEKRRHSRVSIVTDIVGRNNICVWTPTATGSLVVARSAIHHARKVRIGGSAEEKRQAPVSSPYPGDSGRRHFNQFGIESRRECLTKAVRWRLLAQARQACQ